MLSLANDGAVCLALINSAHSTHALLGNKRMGQIILLRRDNVILVHPGVSFICM